MYRNVVKTRLGHYWVPGSGAFTALVVGRNPDTVNVVAWDANGDVLRHLDVPLTGAGNYDPNRASFHLVSSCPVGCPESEAR